MNNEQFEQSMRSAGFSIWNTGGGCTAWGFNRADGVDVMACQDLHYEWMPELSELDSDWLDYGVGLVDSEGQSIDEAYRCFKDINAALAYAIELKEVQQ
jgi:hypothetical protein